MNFFDLAIFVILGASALMTITLLGISAASLLQSDPGNCKMTKKKLPETVMICKGEHARQLM